jgi:hypothetical protein
MRISRIKAAAIIGPGCHTADYPLKTFLHP